MDINTFYSKKVRILHKDTSVINEVQKNYEYEHPKIMYYKDNEYIYRRLKTEHIITIMKKHLCTLMVAMSVISCQNRTELSPDPILYNEAPTETTYAISADGALANLEAFMADSDNPMTKAKRSLTVSSITPIKYTSIATRGNHENLDCDNLLYVANFEDDQGYAILAGDTRIEDKVIAVADDGYLSDATIYTAIELADAERWIIDGYPTTGAGIFTTKETGDELFINPNTISLYDENVGDTFVGNLRLDDINIEDENGVPVKSTTPNIEQGFKPELISTTLCVSYAVNEIQEYKRVELLQDDIYVGSKEVGEGSSTPRTETKKSGWRVIENASPILSKYVSWKQSSPFNDLYPKKRKYFLLGKRDKAPAGCFPLAIAKILTHFEQPNSFTYNGYTVNWGELKNSYNSAIGKLSAAHLLKGISAGCECWYFYEGTFTFPSKATSFMRFIGFENAHSHNYSFDRVKEMIDNGCPLIIYSVPGINVLKSHSWNIDGYIIKERTITTEIYSGSVLNNTITKTETCRMVHCDFGWNGKCNGYYASGVFKLDDSNIEHDPGTSYSGNTNYNNILKVITYNKL